MKKLITILILTINLGLVPVKANSEVPHILIVWELWKTPHGVASFRMHNWVDCMVAKENLSWQFDQLGWDYLMQCRPLNSDGTGVAL